MTTTDERPPFQLLAVCTGNICRSPAVERLLARRMGVPHCAVGRPTATADRLRTPARAAKPTLDTSVLISSAGVAAVVGAAISEPMSALLLREDANLDVSGFGARQLTAEMLTAADLVLTLTRQHRAAAVEMSPGVVRRTFTLRELARLALGIDLGELPSAPGSTAADRLRALVPLAAAQRGIVPSTPADDDVVDPYGGGAALYRISFDQMRPAIDAVAALARGADAP